MIRTQRKLSLALNFQKSFNMLFNSGTKLIAVTVFLFVAFQYAANAQTESDVTYFSKDSIKQGKYTLIYINKDKNFDSATGEKLKSTFFAVYPELAKAYNKKTARKVTFVIDPAYDGVAATSDARVVFNPKWFERSPGDIDVVTHEVMHIVQAYGDSPGPWWITEGIADYVRYKYGVDNTGAGWSLPDVNAKQNYDNSYRVTARFLVWIERIYSKNFVKKLDKEMRAHTYQDDIWAELTGKNVADLWNEYTSNPGI